MPKPRDKKTNAIRELDAARIPYTARFFDGAEGLSGTQIAALLGLDPNQVFKTLVTKGRSGDHHVFMVPVACELDLKKAAAAADEKSIAMIKSKELLPLTGYVHGGCSPIGMKKRFPTYIDETATLFDAVYFSGGKIGCQLKMKLEDLERIVPLQVCDVTVV